MNMDYVRLSRNLYVHYVRLSTSFVEPVTPLSQLSFSIFTPKTFQLMKYQELLHPQVSQPFPI